MSYKEPDYEAEVERCLKTMTTSTGFFNKRNA